MRRCVTMTSMARSSNPAAPPSSQPEEPQQVWENDDDPLILWMLSLTPAERLAAAEGFADSLWRISRERET
jgi:hypothetical protein